jgi:hypothetical protein
MRREWHVDQKVYAEYAVHVPRRGIHQSAGRLVVQVSSKDCQASKEGHVD